jgi:MoCo/4Fe-4S cofactor protein with predicted Tat translocation signal
MNPRKDLAPKLEELRQRLERARGKKYWRTLEELADSEAFQELVRQEFPGQTDTAPDGLSRRGFLTLMGASLALAGLSGCSTRPAASVDIRPYVRQPEEVIPGRPLFYATAMTLGGVAVGLLVESHLGRPTKIEGNPDHPASLGATDLFHQASVLTLYDPDRSQTVTLRGQPSTWEAAFGVLKVRDLPSIRSAADEHRRRRGAGLRLLTETVVSPTLGAQLEDFLKDYPEAKWHQYDPITRDMARRGSDLAFGRQVNVYHDFTKADRVVSLDADFLTCGPGNLRYVADFMSRRRVRTTKADAKNATMNRLYVVETTLTSTGAKADHRLAVRAAEVENLARALATKLGVPAGGSPGPHEKWLAAVARDLEQHRGRCVVLAGDRQPPAVHLIAHALNEHLGNIGHTVLHTPPIETRPVDQLASLRELVEDMDKGRVEMLVILDANPVFTAPADYHFTESLQKVRLRVHLGLYQDATARQCHWHLPQAYYLEAWGDARAFDGTASIVQPLILPLYQGRSAHEVVSLLTSATEVPGRETVKAYWRKEWQARGASGSFDDFWDTALHDGIVPGTAFEPRSESLRRGWEEHLRPAAALPAPEPGTYEIVFQSDPTVYDGRFANNGWLQELPKPLTKLTWDNAALVSPKTAQKLGVGMGGYGHGGEHGGFHQPVVELEVHGARVEAPVWLMPGHADDSVTVYLGYGREYAGRLGGMAPQVVGFNAYLLRTSQAPWFAPGMKVRKTGKTYLLANTQQHQLMENREPVRAASLEQYKEDPTFAKEKEETEEKEETRRSRRPLTLIPQWEYKEHKWGMVIDLTACTGCKACVVACQAENNIPVVGKDQVAAGREMHWLRIDRYISGPFEEPTEFHFQPVPCMHCENAPCEYVCPVEATVHSAEGLNEMLYQRCVGTRFCSNNCPYKVRRFNFFTYAEFSKPTLQLQYNPDVTVRSRGVMEKCSYCVQRIRQAEIDSQKEERGIADGEVLTACQAACPAEAIVFGDLNDPNSKVARWKATPLEYGLLADLNTQPRTTYLGALRHPNPELEGK